MAEPSREELAALVDQLRIENADQAKMIEQLTRAVRAARGLRWVHPLDRGRYEESFDIALEELDKVQA